MAAPLRCSARVWTHIYPPEHKPLAVQIAEAGLVVSEHPPGTPPLPHHFPLRNRLISGLSLAVVVIEASEKSGSLITAGCALEQGREVMAVPGNVLSGRNRGGHALLKDGAKIVETADDIVEGLGWNPAADRSVSPETSSSATAGSTDPVLRGDGRGSAIRSRRAGAQFRARCAASAAAVDRAGIGWSGPSPRRRAFRPPVVNVLVSRKQRSKGKGQRLQVGS